MIGNDGGHRGCWFAVYVEHTPKFGICHIDCRSQINRLASQGVCDVAECFSSWNNVTSAECVGGNDVAIHLKGCLVGHP